MGGGPTESPDDYQPLAPDGPAAYRSDLPLAEWAALLRAAGIPAQVSHHAGTYLCNATLYLSHYLAETQGLKTRATFIHVPLDISQTVHRRDDLPSLSCALSAAAVRLILEAIARDAPPEQLA